MIPYVLLRNRTRHLRRFGISMLGPATVSGANLLMSVLLSGYLSPTEYGLYAFANVLVAFGNSISNALFGTVLAIKLAESASRADGLSGSYFILNYLFCCVMATIAFLSMSVLGVSYFTGLLYAAFAFSSLLRWFARSHGYASQRVRTVSLSDLCYGGMTIAGSGALLATRHVSMTAAVFLLTSANVIALCFFTRDLAAVRVRGRIKAALQTFRANWSLYSKWALVGVIASEGAYNAHAYLVTAVVGTRGFAPLALAALFWRPTELAMSTLTQVERAVLAGRLSSNAISELRYDLRYFRLAIFGVFACNVVLVGTGFGLLFSIWLRQKYNYGDVAVAVGLVALIFIARVTRSPESALLQAAGALKSLALAECLAALVTLAGVAIMLAVTRPAGSLVGVLAGEMLSTILVLRLSRVWKRSRFAPEAE